MKKLTKEIKVSNTKISELAEAIKVSNANNAKLIEQNVKFIQAFLDKKEDKHNGD